MWKINGAWPKKRDRSSRLSLLSILLLFRRPHVQLQVVPTIYLPTVTIIIVIQSQYEKAISSVFLNNNIGRWFRTTVGVRQGYLLSPTLFDIFLERIMKEAPEDHESIISIGGRHLTNLRFADDIDELAGKEEELATLTEQLVKTFREHETEIRKQRS
ncbi:endonuclease-reverse transcriptase [Plakobranchus ocellatus]|uniref:Endonuclease-reverse transcriptase n=1 Tax=Plakobranchus ocellatus TaxID=259542 RepID=A0AAV4C721_9GAST|nr:endonuclease-reverse transcriptase [Plakobranchus ocellatus]